MSKPRSAQRAPISSFCLHYSERSHLDPPSRQQPHCGVKPGLYLLGRLSAANFCIFRPPQRTKRARPPITTTIPVWNTRSSACRVATSFAMISHEAGHDVKMPRGVGVGPTLRKRKTHGQIEGLSGETGCLLSVPDLHHMSRGVKHNSHIL